MQLSYSDSVIKKQKLELQQQSKEITKLKSVNLQLHETLNKLKSKISQLEPININITENHAEIRSSYDIINKGHWLHNEKKINHAKPNSSANIN